MMLLPPAGGSKTTFSDDRRQSFLGDALQSIEDQSYPLNKLEIIVVDDYSTEQVTDNVDFNTSAARSTRAGCTTCCIRHERNLGLSAARNTGLHMATNTFILPLDADDKIHPHFIDLAMAAWEERPATKHHDRPDRRQAIWIPIPRTSLGRGRRTHPGEPAAQESPVQLIALPRLSAPPGGYDESMKDGYEDWEFWIRLLRLGAEVITVESRSGASRAR